MIWSKVWRVEADGAGLFNLMSSSNLGLAVMGTTFGRQSWVFIGIM